MTHCQRKLFLLILDSSSLQSTCSGTGQHQHTFQPDSNSLPNSQENIFMNYPDFRLHHESSSAQSPSLELDSDSGMHSTNMSLQPLQTAAEDSSNDDSLEEVPIPASIASEFTTGKFAAIGSDSNSELTSAIVLAESAPADDMDPSSMNSVSLAREVAEKYAQFLDIDVDMCVVDTSPSPSYLPLYPITNETSSMVPEIWSWKTTSQGPIQ